MRGEGMDGERTHHLLRRCGHRGQPPAARCWRGSRVWMSTWTTCRRAGVGCGRRRVVPRPSGSCTVCPQRRPQGRPRECGWSVVPGPRDDVDGRTRGEPGSGCGSSRVGLWTVSGVLPGMPGRALPTRLSTACGSVDEGGRGELPDGRSRTGRGATHRWGEACGQRGIAGYRWVSDDP